MHTNPYEIKWTLRKYDAAQTAGLTDAELESVTPLETLYIDGNLMLNQGRDLINGLLMGTGGIAMSTATALIHVGDSSVSEVKTQTDLQGAGTYNDTTGTPHKWKKPMESGFPQVVNGAIRYKARFLSAEANFAWNEFGVSNGTALFNRKVASPSIGTKTTEDELITGSLAA